MHTHTHTDVNLRVHRIKAFCRHSTAWLSEPYWVILAAVVQPHQKQASFCRPEPAASFCFRSPAETKATQEEDAKLGTHLKGTNCAGEGEQPNGS